MTTGLPSQTQVIELLSGEFARAGYEIEDVVIDSRARPPRITVVADGDTALDLDTIAVLSRSASDLLDGYGGSSATSGSSGSSATNTTSASYVLEVSSPGVERPLTSRRHFRRARGRRVELALADGSQLTGRVGATGEDTVALVVRTGRNLTLREIPLRDVVSAVVQVEFSSPNRAELELAESDRAAGTEAGS